MATARPIQGKKEKLLRLIECPICLNELQDPRLLSCRHTLCYTCVRDYTEKGNYGNQLPCPVCRGVTDLYQGGVDNLPKFFFMNELKEVVTEQGDEDDSKPSTQSERGPTCSTEDCGQTAVKYCTDGCQFLCKQCYDDHQRIRFTKNHQVIPASEGGRFVKPRYSAHPPCNRHKHYVLDLYCRTCNIPICTTCCQLNHQGHDCCELEEQAQACKIELKQIRDETDQLIDVVKQAIDKTVHQTEQAGADIDEAFDNVKSTFKIMHDQLNNEEKKILSDLHEARRRVTKTSGVIADSQTMSLASLESLQSCQIKLIDKNNDYDFVTVTDSIKRDVEDHYGQQLPELMWSCQFMRKDRTGVLCPSGKVELTETEEATGHARGSKKPGEPTSETIEVEEVGRIRLHNHQKPVLGLVVYKEHIYTVHHLNFIVYCFSKCGILCSKYKHEIQEKTVVQGMCLLMIGETTHLVVSDRTNRALVWIRIADDFTMQHHNTQHLDYRPLGSFNDNESLLVCDDDNMIHRYSPCGQPLDVIRLPEDVSPWRLTRYGDQYIVADYENDQIVIVDKEGGVKTRYQHDSHGVALGRPCDIITDTEGMILITDDRDERVLLLNQAGNEVRQLLLEQHILDPSCLYLDTDHQILYVSGEDQEHKKHVFIYDYSQLKCQKTSMKLVTKLDLMI